MKDSIVFKYYFMDNRKISFDEFFLLEHTAMLSNKMSRYKLFDMYRSSSIGKFYISLN